MGRIEIISNKLVSALVAGVLLSAAAIGAATGVSLAGDGDDTEAIIVTSVDVPDDEVISDVSTISDDGSVFRLSANVHRGARYRMHLTVTNLQDHKLSGELALTVPEPYTVTVTGINSEVSPISQERWVIELPARATVAESMPVSGSYTTTHPVADQNGDGVVNRGDITIRNASGNDSRLGEVSLNPNGTLTIESAQTSSNDEFVGEETIQYTTGSTFVIAIRVPHDIEAGFYTIGGEILLPEI